MSEKTKSITYRFNFDSKWIYINIGQTFTSSLLEKYTMACINGEKFYRKINEIDCDGNEIYEGDVLEFIDKWEWYRGIWGPKFYFASPDEKKELKKEYDNLPNELFLVDELGDSFSSYDNEQQRFRVIGNIEHNPELLNIINKKNNE